MNCRKGFRRIAFLGAIFVACCCSIIPIWFISIIHYDAGESLRREWRNHQNEYNPCRLYRLIPEDGGKFLYECMDILEFRQKYPKYNDINDVNLTSILHKAYYDDYLPFDEFTKVFGLPQPPEGFVYERQGIRLSTLEKKVERQSSKERLKELEDGFWVNLSVLELYTLFGLSGLVGGIIGFVFVWFIYKMLEWLFIGETVKKQNQEVKEPIQKGDSSMAIVKYACPQCKTSLEVERLTVEKIVQCKKCKTMINLLPPPPPLPKKKLSLKQKQKRCLWIGTGIMDLVGAAILHDRVVGRYGMKWSALDAFFLITLIIITTAVFFYTLSLTDEKPKDE